MKILYKIITFLYQRPKYTTIGGKKILEGKTYPSFTKIQGILVAYIWAFITSFVFLLPLLFYSKNLVKIFSFYFLIILILSIILNLYVLKGRIFSLPKLKEFLTQIFIQTFLFFLISVVLGSLFIGFSFLPASFQINKYLLPFIFFIIYFSNFVTESGFNYFAFIVKREHFFYSLKNSLFSTFLILFFFFLNTVLLYVSRYLSNMPNLIYFIALSILCLFFFWGLFTYRDSVDFTNYKETLKLTYKTLSFGVATTLILVIIYYVAFVVLAK